VGRGSIVGIATRYGLDGPEIESRWERNFPHLPRGVLVSTDKIKHERLKIQNVFKYYVLLAKGLPP
jgi:hypothetical protein